MQSKMNAEFILHDDQCVLSIVKHNEHAMFLLEEYVDDEYSIRKIHFVPAGGGYCILYGASLSQLVGNKTVAGAVDNPTLGMGKPHIECSREEIFSKLKLEKDKGVSWEVSRTAMLAMIQQVQYEKIGPVHAPPFNIKGKRRAEEAGHNCCTWVIEKAALAGLDAEPYLRVGTIAYWLELPNLPPANTLFKVKHFDVCLPAAATVHVAGEFNNWLNAASGKIQDNDATNKWRMQKDSVGNWVIDVLILPGRYEYKFVIDCGPEWYPHGVGNNRVIDVEEPVGASEYSPSVGI